MGKGKCVMWILECHAGFCVLYDVALTEQVSLANWPVPSEQCCEEKETGAYKH